MAEKFDSLEEHLEKFVENIRQLGIIVSDFQPSSQTGLNQKLNFMVTGLQDIDKCRQQLHDISVPLEVFEKVGEVVKYMPVFIEALDALIGRDFKAHLVPTPPTVGRDATY
uniref:Mediator of RNA polymerase II transcription subunit 10 n=1 Tax=Cyanistes caeruleus TaxID=156563 RepID=A0A8C0UVL4_CYACU